METGNAGGWFTSSTSHTSFKEPGNTPPMGGSFSSLQQTDLYRLQLSTTGVFWWAHSCCILAEGIAWTSSCLRSVTTVITLLWLLLFQCLRLKSVIKRKLCNMNYIHSLSKIIGASSLLHTGWNSSGRSLSWHGEYPAFETTTRGLMTLFSSISSFSFFTDSRENVKLPSYIDRKRKETDIRESSLRQMHSLLTEVC